MATRVPWLRLTWPRSILLLGIVVLGVLGVNLGVKYSGVIVASPVGLWLWMGVMPDVGLLWWGILLAMWCSFGALGVWAWRRNSWLLAVVFDVLLIASAILSIRAFAAWLQAAVRGPYG